MTIRGIRCATQEIADALAAKQRVAAGYPRCERLAGALALDGVPISASDPRLTCACTRADTPHASCPYATRAEVTSVRLATGWACPVTESKPAVLAALTAGERASIVSIDESERRAAAVAIEDERR